MLHVNGVPNSFRNENQRIHLMPNSLKPGQLIMGRVLEIYPQQKAAIQFAGRQVIAKLETALKAKHSYFFQITDAGNILHLKKIGEISDNHMPVGKLIMQQLGLPDSRSLQSIIQKLTNQQIPFTTREGYEMAHLLDKFGDNQKNQELLIYMLERKLALTESSFKSMQTFRSSSVTAEMQKLLTIIQQTNPQDSSFKFLEQQLAAYIANRNSRSADISLGKFINNSQQSLTKLLAPRSDLVRMLTDPNRSISQTEELMNHVNQRLQQQISISDKEENYLQTFIKRLGEAISQDSQQNLQKNVRSHPLFQKLLAGLSSTDKYIIQQWLGGNSFPDSSNQVLAIFEKTANQQLSANEQHLLRQLLLHLDVTNSSVLTTKDRFLQLMKHFIQTSGLLDEARIAQSSDTSRQSGPEQQSYLSLKQQLLLMNQQSLEMAGDSVQRLIQALTGLQLHMTNQDLFIARQNIHIPGGKFGLAEDIKIQFEGKQNGVNKEINSDYCRILFHLQLAKMGETYIALMIQKRVINMTVYNDTPQIKSLINHFSPLLKEKVAALDYRLSALTHKSIKETNHRVFEVNNRQSAQPDSINEGIDFRI